MPDGALRIDRLLIERAAVDGTAVIADQGCLTYVELDETANAAAAALLSAGAKPGDRVAVSSSTAFNCLLAFLGTQVAGFVWVGIKASLPPSEQVRLCEEAGARIVILDDPSSWVEFSPGSLTLLPFGRPDGSDGGWWRMVHEHKGHRPAVDVDGHALAALAFTSGTTGRPKGVMHSQHGILTLPFVAQWASRAEDGSNWSDGLVKAVNIPLSILNGIIFGPLDTFVAKGTYVCVDRPGSIPLARAIEAHDIQYVSTVPTVIWDFVHKPEVKEIDISSLTHAGVGGSGIDDDLCKAISERLDVRLIQEYGMTEGPAAVAGGRVFWEDLSPGAVGPPYRHVDVRALSDTSEPLPDGETGEIGVRAVDGGPWAGVYTGMLGYWKDPEQTAAVTQRGWFHTGDLGYIVDTGELVLVGRKKEMILRGGENIFPAEIERVLRDAPGLVDFAVAGVPDPRLGEAVGAFVQTDSATWPGVDEFAAWVAERLQKTRPPDRWFIVEQIPRNAMQKVQRHELLNLMDNEVAPAGPKA